MCETMRMLGYDSFNVAQESHEPFIDVVLAWDLFSIMKGESELLMLQSGEDGRHLENEQLKKVIIII